MERSAEEAALKEKQRAEMEKKAAAAVEELQKAELAAVRYQVLTIGVCSRIVIFMSVITGKSSSQGKRNSWAERYAERERGRVVYERGAKTAQRGKYDRTL